MSCCGSARNVTYVRQPGKAAHPPSPNDMHVHLHFVCISPSCFVWEGTNSCDVFEREDSGVCGGGVREEELEEKKKLEYDTYTAHDIEEYVQCVEH